MRRNIFEVMQGNKLNLYEEYFRIKILFQHTHFECENSIKKFIECNNYFKNWPHRKRYISVDDLLSSLKINNDDINEQSITLEKLLIYCETIYNLVNFIEPNILDSDSISVIDAIKNNILDLLDDMNYEIKDNNLHQSIIVEKSPITTAVVEKFSELTDTVIEYRRFSLKGNIESKKEILLKLADRIEPLRKKLNGTTYKNILEDINMLLNNLNIRHNNLEGKYKQEYTINMAKEELEKWYDTTYDMILSALMLEDYIDNKKSIDELKTHY